ncbi:MAG TPA: DedA family protein [Ktedonobacterales bacterium]|jgi:membrane protein DedA with SNARE-associated domain
MDVHAFIGLVGQYGYGALFFCLWLGIVGLPLPDEAIVMAGGLVTALGLLQPIPAFLVTCCGVISGLTFGYCLGRLLGARGVNRLRARHRWRAPLSTSLRLIRRYGPVAICLSYCFPVVRHLVPYLVGSSGMNYTHYSLYSYSAGCLWTLLYFTLGYWFGDSLASISGVVEQWGWWLLFGLVVVGLGYTMVQGMRGRLHGRCNDLDGG